MASPWLISDAPRFHDPATPIVRDLAGAVYALLRLYVMGYVPLGDDFYNLYFGHPTGVAEVGG